MCVCVCVRHGKRLLVVGCWLSLTGSDNVISGQREGTNLWYGWSISGCTLNKWDYLMETLICRRLGLATGGFVREQRELFSQSHREDSFLLRL